jgi:hypothetical protein
MTNNGEPVNQLRRSHAWIALLGIAGSAGCGGGEAGDLDDSRYSTETLPSGVVRVTNDGVGQWTPETAWRLEEDLRLGSVNEEGPELFGDIAYVETDPQGRIYLLESQAREVRVFNADGVFSHRFGGPGEGPGELAAVGGMTWTPEGQLWLAPFARGRHTVFDSLGTEVARHPRNSGNAVRPWSGGFLADGRFIDWVGERETTGRDETGRPTTNGRTTYAPHALTPPDRIDTLPAVEYWHPVTSEGQIAGNLVPGPSKNPALHVGRDALWFAMPDEYTVYKRAPEGDTLLAFSIPGRPLVYSASAIDSAIAAVAARGGTRTRDSYYAQARLVMRVLTDGAGHVYVFPQEEGLPTGEAVDVFTEAGVYLGRMRFPVPVVTEATPPHVTGDHLYAVVRDALDVQYLARFRIVRP